VLPRGFGGGGVGAVASKRASHTKSKSKVSASSGKKGKQPERATLQSLSAKVKSKQSIVLSMLETLAGATIKAMIKRWQAHSVRGFRSGVVRNKLKLNLSSKLVDGDRVYLVAKHRAGRAVKRERIGATETAIATGTARLRISTSGH
jgi:hypothetical protein